VGASAQSRLPVDVEYPLRLLGDAAPRAILPLLVGWRVGVSVRNGSRGSLARP
jgi:hypothetical protein